MIVTRKSALQIFGLTAAAPIALAACSSQGSGGSTTESGKTIVTFWTHSAGNESELEVIHKIVEEFNAQSDSFEVQEKDFPQDGYNDAITGAAASGDLPAVLDLDAPNMPNWVWNGWMSPTGFDKADFSAYQPSCIGEFDGEIYSVGHWDATTCLFTLKSILEEYEIRTPTVSEPWTKDEFAQIQEQLAEAGKWKATVDWAQGTPDEWYPYAFSPLMQSFGGDLIDRETYESADGVLNGEAATEFAQWFQDQIDSGLALKERTADGTDFVDGNVPLFYNGVWYWATAYETYGDDLIMLPAPDFGHGVKSGAGSWQRGLSSTATGDVATGAAEFLKFSLQDEYLAQFSDATSLIPASTTSVELTTKGYYSEGGPMQDAVTLLQECAVVRPVTPAYPVISSVFATQFDNIINGSDVEATLDEMVSEIDSDIATAGYNS